VSVEKTPLRADTEPDHAQHSPPRLRGGP
jgi:hypothetical protein